MNTKFTTEPFRLDDVRPAYALIHSVAPDVSLAAWMRFARRAAHPRNAGRSGIIVVRGAKSYPVGLACYRIDRDLGAASILTAHHFVALELLEARPVTMALVKGLDVLAIEHGCRGVDSVLHGTDAVDPTWFETIGYSRQAAVYRKAVAETTLGFPDADVPHADVSGPPAGPAP